MPAQLGRIIIYSKRTEELVDFYCRHFGFEVLRLDDDRIVELVSQGTGANIAAAGWWVGAAVPLLAKKTPPKAGGVSFP